MSAVMDQKKPPPARGAPTVPRDDPPPSPEGNLTDVTAERSLIGSVLLWPEKFDDVALIVRDSDFWSRELAIAYRAFGKLVADGQSIDAVSAADRMALDQEFGRTTADACALLNECMESVPHGARAEHYAGIIRAKWQRRELCFAGSQAVELGANERNEIGWCLSQTETRLHGILEREAGQKSIDISALLLDTLDAIQSGRREGLRVGFHELDQMTNGLQPGTMTILAARPSMGKTAFALSLLLQAVRDGNPALFLSMEQTRLEVGERILAIHCGLSVNEIRRQPASAATSDSVLQAAQELAEIPLFVDDRSDMDIAQISSTARLWKRRKGLKLIVLDYLQLVRPSDTRAPREQQVARISKELKALAKNLDLPIVVLAQLNRSIESRDVKKPRLSDLRESGAIEQDADLVMFLDRPHVYDSTVDEGMARLFVEKHRNGPKGEVPLQWTPATMHFRPGTKETDAALCGFYRGEDSESEFHSHW